MKRIEPGPGQESVWDYPRPPRIEAITNRLRVEHGGTTVAETTRGHRVLETSQPPAYYFPPDDCWLDALVPSPKRTWCEWKGEAHYWTLALPEGTVVEDVAWSYPDPKPEFTDIKGHLAFYGQRVDACFVDDEQVEANPGTFYGGWITSRIVGPFKGAPDTRHW
jgi:uncharacterized protein (DUF427 family)